MIDTRDEHGWVTAKHTMLSPPVPPGGPETGASSSSALTLLPLSAVTPNRQVSAPDVANGHTGAAGAAGAPSHWLGTGALQLSLEQIDTFQKAVPSRLSTSSAIEAFTGPNMGTHAPAAIWLAVHPACGRK